MSAGWRCLLAALLCACTWGQGPSGQIRGVVADARGGEPLARVEVRLVGTAHQTTTDSKGAFALEGLEPAAHVLHVSTVGYRMVTKPFTLSAGETKEFEVALSPEALSRTDSVDVREGPFELARQESASEMRLSGSEAKNLASVLADDPLRAVQSMPGVTANDDYDSRFSLRGADFSRTGLYLDDILMHAPFHTVETTGATGSLTIFNGDMLDEMALYSGAPPARFSDRTAGVLDIHMRDGNRSGNAFRVSAGAASAGAMAEGPIGKKGSWLVGARKSYLQYLIERASDDPSLAFGFVDVQGRAAYALNARHSFSLSAIQGDSSLDRSSYRTRLGVNALMEAGNRFTVANLGWRFTPAGRFLLNSRVAYLREAFEGSNPNAQPLGEERYSEWVWNSNGTLAWGARTPLDFGWSIRRARGGGFSNRYQVNAATPRLLDRFGGNTVIAGGYAQQSWATEGGAIRLTGGSRWDRHSLSGASAISPYASLSLSPRAGTRIELAWGQYAQFPELGLLLSLFGTRGLLPERALHVVGAVEQRMGDRTRVRAEFYNRDDRDLVFRPLFEPRIVGTRVVASLADAPYRNSLRGYARGAEVFLQRRSANRLTGWVSYALNYSRFRDGVTGSRFVSEVDQRHTVNVYGSYRIRPALNLSAKWMYGSGFPLPGYLRKQGTQYYLASARNAVRLGSYHRADVRVNKAWARDRWKITLYGEVVNLFNQSNYRFDSFNGYDSRTGLANITLNKLFPILPAAGIVFER